ncbi:MAG: hypothetical protein A2X49_04060 [Lentisphaerae bacterium GWF2_52_8]|nr:MAG: hypothetical protein A2X49_04060 [Lentisphaerae bacterium GWF2_52_8]
MGTNSPRFELEAVGLLDVNCYLVSIPENERLYLIDPGADADLIIRHARKFEFKNAAVLLTHAHVDHIGAIREVMDALKISDVYLHPADAPLYKSPDNHLLPYVPAAQNLPETKWPPPKTELKALHTPGHSQGGVCYLFEQFPALFSGDTLFNGSIGRTDFPGGDFAALMNSIATQLLNLPGDLPIYPGHGPHSTISQEKHNNPFLK